MDAPPETYDRLTGGALTSGEPLSPRQAKLTRVLGPAGMPVLSGSAGQTRKFETRPRWGGKTYCMSIVRCRGVVESEPAKLPP